MTAKRRCRPVDNAGLAKHDEAIRDLARLLGRLIATRWRQMHAAPHVLRGESPKGFTRHK
jgi:hypothetical protein